MTRRGERPIRGFPGVLVLLALISAVLPAEGKEKYFVPDRCGESRLLRVEGVPLLVLGGSPEAMGKAHGTLLRREAEQLIQAYLVPAAFLHGGMGRLAARARTMEPALPDRYRKELHALAEASGQDYETVLVGAAFPDVYRGGGCSTLAVSGGAAEEGEPMLARNLDFFPMNVLNRYGVVIVYRPEGYHAFASVTWPGLAGVLSGMNDRGLCAAVMEVRTGQRNFKAMPSVFLFRRVLEEAGSVEEGLALLKAVPRAASNNLILLDASGKAAVAEIGPGRFEVRRPEKGMLFATNHHRVGRVPRYCARYAALERFCRTHEKMDVVALEEALDRVNQGILTVQSMVFRARSLVLHLSMGKIPATQGPYRVLHLKEWMAPGASPAGARPVPGGTKKR